MIPELPEINSGFASCYRKFPNKIRVTGFLPSPLTYLLMVYMYLFVFLEILEVHKVHVSNEMYIAWVQSNICAALCCINVLDSSVKKGYV